MRVDDVVSNMTWPGLTFIFCNLARLAPHTRGWRGARRDATAMPKPSSHAPTGIVLEPSSTTRTDAFHFLAWQQCHSGQALDPDQSITNLLGEWAKCSSRRTENEGGGGGGGDSTSVEASFCKGRMVTENKHSNMDRTCLHDLNVG